MSLRIRSAVFNLLYWIWTAACASTSLVTSFLPPRISRVTLTVWSWGLDVMLRHIVGASIEKSGLENIPSGPAIIASQHQSTWDTGAFQRILDCPSFVLKRELTFIPVFGWYLKRYGMIPIDRSAGGSAIRKMIRLAGRVTAAGRSIVIFPEGTRTRFDADPNYYPGVYALYSLLKIPVVPVALNSGEVWPRHTWRRYPGRIELRFLPPIQPGLARAEFMHRLASAIETASTARTTPNSAHQTEQVSTPDASSTEALTTRENQS